MYQFLDVEEFSPVRVIATVAKSYLHSPTPDRILQSYFEARGMKHPTWLSLHAELEVNHFQNSIRSVLAHYEEDSVKLTSVIKAIERGIERHVQYFDDLLHEYES
jgi:hypothetical protein